MPYAGPWESAKGSRARSDDEPMPGSTMRRLLIYEEGAVATVSRRQWRLSVCLPAPKPGRPGAVPAGAGPGPPRQATGDNGFARYSTVYLVTCPPLYKGVQGLQREGRPFSTLHLEERAERGEQREVHLPPLAIQLEERHCSPIYIPSYRETDRSRGVTSSRGPQPG